MPIGISGCFFTLSSNAATIFSTGPVIQVSSAVLSSNAAARGIVTGAERVAFEAVVGTDEGQMAVAPGTLRRTWTEGGRRYFHYASDVPIGNQYAIFSAEYALHDERWNGVGIQVFHHPGHTANLERMVRSVRASLDYCAAQSGGYEQSYIRLVEIPGPGVGLHAETNTITYREWFTLLRPDDSRRIRSTTCCTTSSRRTPSGSSRRWEPRRSSPVQARGR